MTQKFPATALFAPMGRSEITIGEAQKEKERYCKKKVRSHNDLIQELKRSSVLVSPAIEDALRAVDRKLFVPKEFENEAYEDYPLPIAGGQTISQPRTVVFMLEHLEVRPGHNVLDVGSGSGWTTALLSHLVGEKGRVIGVELVQEIVLFGQRNLQAILSRSDLDNAHIEQAGKEYGKPEEAPYDRILVSAAAESVPQALVDQLAPGGPSPRRSGLQPREGGRMVIPIKDSICLVTKSREGKVTEECYPGFAFVPLI